MTESTRYIRPLVENVLLRAEDYEWTVQGFGMIRTYLGPKNNPKEIRLNVWDDRLAVPNVSTVHDHPWDFSSLIISGHFVNQRYYHLTSSESTVPTHSYMTIKTGVEGDNSKKLEVFDTVLNRWPSEVYVAGDKYHQTANEIHESCPARGTVTINKRVGDTEQARVFWPYGTDWVDAKPRRATVVEVRAVTQNALVSGFYH